MSIPATRQPITFDSPPVNEVALALQLDAPVIDLETLGLLAGRLKADFPVQEQQVPLPPMEEPVESDKPSFQIEVGLITPTPLPRTWFVASDAHELVQVQADRVVVNWRRLGGEQPYPRYVHMHERLASVLEHLRAVLKQAGKASARVNFAEVTYINEIVVPGVQPGDRHPDLARVLTAMTGFDGQEFLPPPEDAGVRARWRLPKEDLPEGAPIGRLYVAVNPAFVPDTRLPIYAMNLTVRIALPPTEPGAALEILDVGHDWIVRGFADLTTEEMHRLWNART